MRACHVRLVRIFFSISTGKPESQRFPIVSERKVLVGESFHLLLLFSLYQSAEVSAYVLQFSTYVFQTLDDIHVAVYLAALVALEHVARSLECHAPFFDQMVYLLDLFDVGLCVLAYASAYLVGLDVGKFLFPVAQQSFGDVHHARHFAYAVVQL